MENTIVSHYTGRVAVAFKKRTGCPKCLFLDMSIKNSDHTNIESIYLEDHSADDFYELGVTGTPVMAIIEDGVIVERDATVVTVDQLNDFMAKL